LDNENSVFYNNRALALTHLKQDDNALNDLNKAIMLNSMDPRAYFNRGDVYCSIGRLNEAHKDYDMAIMLAKDMPEYKNYCSFHHAKGLAFQFRNEFESAKEYFKLAIEIDPRHVASRFHLGLIQHKLEEYKDALESFTIVIVTNEKAQEQERIVVCS
jgi:tetratricopeptide (TPR) repeat protein